MAVYRFQSGIISRSRGQSVVACAAYRAGEKLHDERYGEIYDYTRKQDVAHNEILLPKNAPDWMGDRQTLWNVVEAAEKRKDSQLARELQLTLPRELTLEQNIQLTREFIQNRFVSSGMVADMAVHVPRASDGEQQPHAHVLLTMREIREEGFGLKVRAWNEKCELEMWRAEWCDYQNKHLALNGHDVRVDHRSLKEQGIDLLPQKKIGVTGLFHRMAAYEQHQQDARTNGERLLADPQIVLDVLTHQQSTFTHQDIARTVNRYTANGEQFQAVYEKVKALPELVSLGQDDKYRDRFTTQAMLQLETEMVGHAVQLAEKLEHGVGGVSVSETAEKHGLSAGQGRVLGHLVQGGDLVNVVGYAGTGKSRLLGAAREVWEQAGHRVSGATLSGIAADNLEGSSGIESRTLASRMYAWEKGQEQLTGRDILVIDEAGMLGSRQLATVLEQAAKHGAKVVLVGDPEQLQAIEAGAAFRAITDKTAYVELTDIWRQQTDWQKTATVQFATQQTADALEQYAQHDCLHGFATQAEAKAAMVSAWNDVRIANADKTQIMLAYTRADAADLNHLARAERQSLGELGDDHVVQTARGERAFAEGDRVYFLKNDRELGVKNGTLGTVTAMDEQASGKTMQVQLDNETNGQPKAITVSLAQYDHLDHGYAATIHKGQGVTVDRTYVLASPYLDRHATYVAMTRHREGAEVFWSRETFPDYGAMIKTLGRERAKDTTIDYLGEAWEKASFAAHRGLDTLWDTFWEKHGKEWVDSIRQTLSGWTDSAKALVDTVKEQVGQTLGVLGPEEAAWLKETREWIDKTFGKNDAVSTEATRENRYKIPDLSEKEVVSSDANNKLTNEERFQRIMKDAERWELQQEKDRLLKPAETTHPAESMKKSAEKIKDHEIEM